jgi:hypothetical protein
LQFKGFIGAAYQLDSVNVDNQRCVNLYPEVIESGFGKGGQVAYLRATPGLEGILEVGDGPLRLLHVDSIGRIFVVSGNQIFLAVHRDDWALKVRPTSYAVIDDIAQATDVDATANTFTSTAHGYYTGLKVQLTSTTTMPTGLTSATDYWVIVDDANTFKVAASLSDAGADIEVNFSAVGSGTLTVTPQIPEDVGGIGVEDIDVDTDMLAAVDHNLYTGLRVQITMSGVMPTGLASVTDYYIIKDDDDNFQLADSIANALAGAEVNITAVSTDEWATNLIGADGEVGGTTFTLFSSTGPVRAASMSFGGEGTDSSTVFVDGSHNYLFKDEDGDTTLRVMGEVNVARVIFNIDDDITIYSTTDVDTLVAEGSFTIVESNFSVGAGAIEIDFYTESILGVPHPYDYILHVRIGSGASLTTAELVSYMINGFVSGKTIAFNTNTLPLGATYVSNFSKFVISGGGTQTVTAAFPGQVPVTMNFSAAALSGLEFGSVPTATDIKWSDGYFILAEGGTNRFRVSDLQSFNVDTLSFASSEGNPDIVLSLAILNRYLYILNEKTTEVYANTGNADFPFERIGGGFIEVGCAAAGSVAKAGSTICFLGRSEFGEGVVYAIEGLQPRRISTHAIEQAIRSYADPSTAVGYSYETAGHAFYVLNFDEATWVHDVATGLWHERGYTNEGVLERHRAQHCVYIMGHRIHLVSDYETNEIYIMSEDVYSDDGDAITRIRSTPHLSAGGNQVFCSRFTLDMEVGIGLDGGVQGSSPTVMLDWSNDSGHTWSSEQWALADAGSGQIGDYAKRVIWNRLGKFRQRVFRVKITDPVKVRLIDAHIDIEGGRS